MIRANISEVKSRLSHYLRLVRGGEQVEILDRNTPLARIVHVAQSQEQGDASWIQEVLRLGLVAPPRHGGLSEELLSGRKLVITRDQQAGVLKALLDERAEGR